MFHTTAWNQVLRSLPRSLRLQDLFKEEKNMTPEKKENILILDTKALEKRYHRRRFKDLRNLHALVDCREEYLHACWAWLYGRKR